MSVGEENHSKMFSNFESDIWDNDSIDPKLTEFERNLMGKYTFDTHPQYKEYNDLRIYSMQSSLRFCSLVNLLKFPYIPPFNSVFCVFDAKHYGYRPEKFLQRRLCQNFCNWDPSQCFLDNHHSGKLQDLMNKSFHDLFNPEFESKFKEDKSGLYLKEDESHHPRLRELIEDLGKPP